MIYNLYATCPNELTALLADEIELLGGKDIRTAYRVVYFTANENLYYAAHMKLSLASRLFRIIKDIPASSPTIIFDKTKRIRFGEIFSHKHPLKINVVVENKQGKVEGHLIGSKIREAITDSFLHFHKAEANLSSRDPKVIVKGYLHKNRLMLSIDTSLEALHKRGFRAEGHPAPLKETLAAALLRLCKYDGSTAFLDPMCGSGTIAVEAALIASRTPPLLQRKKGMFGVEHLEDFNQELWLENINNSAKDRITPKCKIYARDLDPKHVSIAKESATLADMDKHIDFREEDFFSSTKPEMSGLIIANIPYGVRLDDNDIDDAYIDRIGQHLKANFKGWTCGILVPKKCDHRRFGVKASKVVDLLNGQVPVKLVIFEIFPEREKTENNQPQKNGDTCAEETTVSR